MENLKFKLGQRVVYTGGIKGEEETGTIVGIDTRENAILYALCLDNGRGYEIFEAYKTTVEWLKSFDEYNVNNLVIWASSNKLDLLKNDENIKKQFDAVRDRKRAELEEIDKQIEKYKKAIEELEDRRNAIKMDYYL